MPETFQTKTTMPRQARVKPSCELRTLRRNCAVFNPTFAVLDADRQVLGLQLTQKQADAMCKALEDRFANWWDSWVEPELQYLEKRGF